MHSFQSSWVPGGGLSHGQVAAKANARLVNSRVARVGKASSVGPVESEESASMVHKKESLESTGCGDGHGVQGKGNGLEIGKGFESGMLAQNFFEVQIVDPKPAETSQEQKERDFYANVGKAVETLKEETPYLFQKDLTYDIYREDIVFKDRQNSFQGLKFYKYMFLSLRWHGRIFFSNICLEIRNIWLPSDNVIRIRWTIHGNPRIPWEAEGIFDGVSTYKLDRDGKIYEHAIDNIIFRDPPIVELPLLFNNLIVNQPAVQQPCPGAWFRSAFLLRRFSLVRMYAVFLITMQVLDRG